MWASWGDVGGSRVLWEVRGCQGWPKGAVGGIRGCCGGSGGATGGSPGCPTPLPNLDLLLDELLGVVDLLGGAADDEELEVGVAVGGQLAADLHEGPRLLVDGFDVLPACERGGHGGAARGGPGRQGGRGAGGRSGTLGGVGGFRGVSPLPITNPHLWVGMEKVISPPGGPQLPWPRPRPRPPGGIPGPGGPGGPLCGERRCQGRGQEWKSTPTHHAQRLGEHPRGVGVPSWVWGAPSPR